MNRTFSLFLSLVLYLFPYSVFAATFTVTNTLDAGAGSLRDAITQANASVGADVINFNVSGTITLMSDLPGISEELFVDGSSAPGWVGVPPVLIIDGANNVTQVFLVLATATQTHIRGMVIINGNNRGIYIEADDCNVTNCYIGAEAGGLTAASNAVGIEIRGSDCTIGSDNVIDANLISGNDTGIRIYFSTTGNTVQGNLIGTDITGNGALPNTVFGVQVYGDNALIGGNTAGSRNIISGNANGMQLLGDNNEVYNNLIGLNFSGNAAIPNTGLGVLVQGDANFVGGGNANERNVISGNGGVGMAINGTMNEIQGNYIGLDETGLIAIGNTANGISLNGGDDNLIGGLTPQAGNVISGNGGSGIACNSGSLNGFYGNYIGTDQTGTVAMGNQALGIAFNSGNLNIIGNGTAAGANVICANQTGGITFNGSLADGNQAKFNYIGTDPTGLLNLANGGTGIICNGGASDNEIGGLLPGEGNIIAFNVNGAVSVNSNDSDFNLILGNSIYDHAVDGIRLNVGSNDDQPAPVLTGYANGPGTTTIFGTFNDDPNTTYRIEFFASSTSKQGQIFMGSTDITTDGTGFYALAEVLAYTVTGAQPIISATATDPNNNTSEFGVETVLNADILALTVEATPSNAALLTWQTPLESEKGPLVIEHRQGSADFQSLGQQDQYHKANDQLWYQYAVDRLVPGTHYFRLASRKADGTTAYSNIVAFDSQPEDGMSLNMPNPIRSQAELKLQIAESQALEVVMYDLQGAKVAQLYAGQVQSHEELTISLDAKDFASGYYLLEVQGSMGRLVRKLQILH